MTSKSFFKLAIQLCGLYFVFTSIVGITKLIAYVVLLQRQLSSTEAAGLIIAQFASIAIAAIVGLIIIFAAQKITGLFVRTDDPVLLNVTKESILEMAMILLGIQSFLSLRVQFLS